MRRLLIFVIAALTCAGLTGCGSAAAHHSTRVTRCAAAFSVMEHRGIALMTPHQIRAHGSQQDVAALRRAQRVCGGLNSRQAQQAAANAAP